MDSRSKVTAIISLALSLVFWAAQADETATTALLAAYHHMDLAASRRNVKDYMAYDSPGFVAGAGGRLSRSQAASIVGMQMKYALWFRSKTKVRQINVQGRTAKAKTQLHQEFLSSYLMPNGKREMFVLDLQNFDTWVRRNNHWQRVSSKTVAMQPQRLQP